jgi:CRP/FNR family transcriptional regulator
MDEAIAKKLDKFFSQFKHQTYKKGEILVRADDDPSGIFYLKKGLVKEYAISKKGDELIVNVFKPISFFPMSWAINNTPNEYFFEAVEETEVLKAPADKAVDFIKREPDVLFNLLSRLYRGTDGLLTRMSYLMSGNAYTRLITELLIQAKRFGKQNENKSIELKIPEKDLAARSGLTRETISREIKILRKKRLIEYKKSLFTIRNLRELENELN